MARTKQINVSVPADAVPMLAEFDDCCKDVGLSRSEVLVELMTHYVSQAEKARRKRKMSQDTLDIPEGLL